MRTQPAGKDADGNPTPAEHLYHAWVTTGAGKPRTAGTVTLTLLPTRLTSSTIGSPWKLGISFTTEVVGLKTVTEPIALVATILTAKNLPT
jgi:hypothetical protein